MKEILKIKKYTNEDGVDKYEWDFPDKENVYKLVGILEQIKLDLLDYVATSSCEKEDEEGCYVEDEED